VYKSNIVSLFLCLFVCTAMGATIPTVEFDTIRADFNGDSITDIAFGNISDSVFIISVHSFDSKGQHQAHQLSFLLNPMYQNGLCGIRVNAKKESMDYDPRETVGDLEGFKQSLSYFGINIHTTDLECDSFHIFWNHKARIFQWWRL